MTTPRDVSPFMESVAHPIDPKAARRWLVATMAQNRRRLDRINAKSPIV